MLDNIYLNSFLVDILKKDGEFKNKTKKNLTVHPQRNLASFVD